jgi:hypothetical protein
MRRSYTRGPNRLHLIHIVLKLIVGRGWFSAHQAASATYFGQGPAHPQQRKRVRQTLDRYVKVGLLEHNSRIAACPLYRIIQPAAQGDPAALSQLKRHARRKVRLADKFVLKLLKDRLDLLVPRNVNPALFNQHGHLVLRPWCPPRADSDPSTVSLLDKLEEADMGVAVTRTRHAPGC